MKHCNFVTVPNLMLMVSIIIQSNQLIAQTPQNGEGKWMIRYNQPGVQESFKVSTSEEEFTLRTSKINSVTDNLYVFYHLRLEKPIKGLAFDYKLVGNASLLPITIFDAAANELWRYDSQDSSPGKVELNDLKVRGQIIFRISKDQAVEVPEGWSHSISNIKLTTDSQKPVVGKDGFILVDNITEFRGYASEDNVKVRLKAGPYQIDKALCKQFVEFTGNNSYYDLNGVSLMVDTKLFSQTNVAEGVYDERLYAAMAIQGNNITMEGPYIETYGGHPGITSRNKIFNITGSGIMLKNAEVRTAGSNPWGYGSLYGISGGIIRKMNGIRIGWPAKDTKLIGCRVHMRAMGHAIFVQGAMNTLIEDCHVDGLLRTTDQILKEKSGLAFDNNFKAGRGRITPGKMICLSEDGIRMYNQAQKLEDTKTGSTKILNCTVTQMRRGICTGISSAGDMIINCEVTNCADAGFNAGNSDIIINSRADAKYSEAVCIPYGNSQNAKIELEILDSRDGLGNSQVARITGTNHSVTLRTSNPSFIPDNMTIKLSSGRGNRGSQGSSTSISANIKLTNETPAKIVY